MPVANVTKIAFCSVIAALSVVVMMLGGIIPIASVALPAVAGCFLIPVTAELSEKYGFTTYAVVAVVAFFLTADREAMLIYILFFGYYPVLYSVLCKIQNKVIAYIIKLIIFNVAAIVEFFIATFVFMIPVGLAGDYGIWMLLGILLLANVVFVIYDFGMKDVLKLYFVRLHPVARKFLKK